MVATATIVDRIESGLTLVTGDIRALADLELEWDQLDESVRASLSLEWSHSMADYLVELDEKYRAGEMTPPQRERYQLLIGELKDALPIIERLDIRRPPVRLDG
jgi:hypothetical protein